MRWVFVVAIAVLVVFSGCDSITGFSDIEEPIQDDYTNIRFFAPASTANPWTINYGPIRGSLSSLQMTGPEVSIDVNYDTPFRLNGVEADIVSTENLVALVSDGSSLVVNQTIPTILIEDDDNGNKGYYIFEVRKWDNTIVSGYHNVSGYSDEDIVNPNGRITWKPAPVESRSFSIDARLDSTVSVEARRSWDALRLGESVSLNTAQIRSAGGANSWNLPSAISVDEGETINYEVRFPVTDGTIEADTVYNAILVINSADFVPLYFVHDGRRRWFGVQLRFDSGYTHYQAPGARDIRNLFQFDADDEVISDPPSGDFTGLVTNFGNVEVVNNQLLMHAGQTGSASLTRALDVGSNYRFSVTMNIDNSGLAEHLRTSLIMGGNATVVGGIGDKTHDFLATNSSVEIKFEKAVVAGEATFSNPSLVKQ